MTISYDKSIIIIIVFNALSISIRKFPVRAFQILICQLLTTCFQISQNFPVNESIHYRSSLNGRNECTNKVS